MADVDVAEERAPLVVLMCGVAGSGKTTWSQQLELQGYVRLSVDEQVWQPFGGYGVDYDPVEYSRLSQSAEESLRLRLLELLAQRDVTWSSIAASGAVRNARSTSDSSRVRADGGS